MGVSSSSLPSVEYDDINPGIGTINKDLKSKDTNKKGICFKPGDVLFGKLRPYLKNWFYANFEGVAVGDFWVLTSNKIDHGFTYSLIQTQQFQYIANLSSGSKMPRSDWNLVSNAKTFIPQKLSEQTSISSIFLSIDSAITLHEEKKRQLESLKSALLQKLFADKSGYPIIRFERYSNSWEQRKLSEIGKVITGSTPSTRHPEYYSEDGIPWVTPTDITENVISDTPRKLSSLGAQVGRVAPAETILVTCIASIGKNTMLANTGSFNQQINGLVPNKQKYDPYFLLTESYHWSAKMKRKAAAGTMQIVSKNEFSAIETFVPGLPEQQTIGSCFKEIDSLITLHQHKIDNLKRLKQTLLQKMFI